MPNGGPHIEVLRLLYHESFLNPQVGRVVWSFKKSANWFDLISSLCEFCSFHNLKTPRNILQVTPSAFHYAECVSQMYSFCLIQFLYRGPYYEYVCLHLCRCKFSFFWSLSRKLVCKLRPLSELCRFPWKFLNSHQQDCDQPVGCWLYQ